MKKKRKVGGKINIWEELRKASLKAIKIVKPVVLHLFLSIAYVFSESTVTLEKESQFSREGLQK